MMTYLAVFNVHIGKVIMNRYKRFLIALFARPQGLHQTKLSKNIMGMQKWRKDLNLSGHNWAKTRNWLWRRCQYCRKVTQRQRGLKVTNIFTKRWDHSAIELSNSSYISYVLRLMNFDLHCLKLTRVILSSMLGLWTMDLSIFMLKWLSRHSK